MLGILCQPYHLYLRLLLVQTIGMRVKYVLVIFSSGLLLTVYFTRGRRKVNSTQYTTKTTPMNDTSTTDNSQQQSMSSSDSTASSQAAESQDQSTETNPLKRYQDLVNSPTTPDGHKVVAAVAAASTVTVAAVANWLMKRKK